LLKTFGGWRDEQLPDGTVVWTSPRGQTYTTCPGSKLLFPSLCRPTAPVVKVDVPAAATNRGLMMPRRTRTRAQNQAEAIAAERRLNAQIRNRDPDTPCDNPYFPLRPPPPDEEDPPPF